MQRKSLALGVLAMTVLVVGSIWFESANAWTDSQVAQAYRNCVRWFRYPAATKAMISEREGISIAEMNKSCLYLKRLGLKGSIAENRRSHAARRSTSGGGHGESHSGPRSCSFGVQCSGDEQCLDGKCIARNQQSCATSGLFQCPSDQKCVNGACQ